MSEVKGLLKTCDRCGETVFLKDYEEAREHMSCFGEYYTADGAVCVDGYSGLCNYCVECQRTCVNY